MATQKNSTAKVKDQKVNLTEERLISSYMEYVLINDKEPRSVFKFCKENNITEDEFYNYFGSFEGLKQGIWKKFFSGTISLLNSSPEYNGFATREKLLTFYYTFFELLTANRSYVLFTLAGDEDKLMNLQQLRGLRKEVKHFAAGLVREANEEKNSKYLKQSETVFSEATWLQMLFLLKFWMNDNSPKFESTDVAIEKSVNTAFDLFDTTPLERVVDLGKFLWKEKMN